MKRRFLLIILSIILTISGNIYAQSLGAGSSNHTFVTHENGQAFAWGRNNLAQLGTGDSTNSNTQVSIDMSGVLSGKTITKVRTGVYHTLVLTSDGEAFSWGSIYGYPLGSGATGNEPNPVAVDMTGVLAGKTIVDISAGFQFSVCIADDGKLYSWGANNVGQLGNSSTTLSRTPTVAQNEAVIENKTITKVASGLNHTIILSSEGRIYTFGSNEYKQTGTNGGINGYFQYPVSVLMGEDTNRVFTDIAAGDYFNVVLENDGTVHTFGKNGVVGSLGNNGTSDTPDVVPVDVTGVLSGKTITKIAAGGGHSLVLTSDNQLFAWGSNAFGELGDGTNDVTLVPVTVDMTGVLSGKTIMDISAGDNHTYVITTEGKVYTWGRNNYGQLGDGTNDDRNVPVESSIGILPVELTSFTASSVDGNINLKWETATELNNYGFEVEKQFSVNSNQLSDWETIGFVKGSGSSNSNKSYNYTDLTPTHEKINYRLKQIDIDGSFEYSNIVEVSGVSPTEYSLDQNYPNPFNPSTKIKYSIPNSRTNSNSSVRLIVFDVLGNEVAELVNEKQSAGNYEIEFNATQLSSGIYFYRLNAGSFSSTKKMILIK